MIIFLKNLNKHNKLILAAVSIIILVGGISLAVWQKPTVHQEVHLHAGFKVFVDDELIDFSDNKYMYFMPCGIDSSEHKTLADKVHLHDRVGDVVHVHAAGIKWKDLFESIKYSLPEFEAIFIRNGEIVENFLETEIQNEESVVIVYEGEKEPSEYIQDQVSIDRIREIASSKESCGSDI